MRIPGPDVVAAGGVHLERSEHRVVIRSICEIAVLDRLADFVREHYLAIRPIRSLRWGPNEEIPDPEAEYEDDVCPVFVVTMEFEAIGADIGRPRVKGAWGALTSVVLRTGRRVRLLGRGRRR